MYAVVGYEYHIVCAIFAEGTCSAMGVFITKGMNSMKRSFLESYGLPHSSRDKFREALQRLKKEHVDLVLGNHPGQSDTQGKLLRLEQGEKSVVDTSQWKKFLESVEDILNKLLDAEMK